MNLGLNLSFATKRWTEPELLAKMCREDFGVKNIQITWDLIDPWWPEQYRDPIVDRYRNSFTNEGLDIDSSFGGVASYSYAQLLAPSAEERAISLIFFKRAIDMTVKIGAAVMGTPVGGMSASDSTNEEKRYERYSTMLDDLRELSRYGKSKGLKEIHIESTPLITEFPHSPDACIKMMDDLSDSDIPIKLLIDWGHALYKPLLKKEADIRHWFTKCATYIGSIHLQQTDGLLDRHWDFTREGIITPELIIAATKEAGLENIIQYLEVVTIFEVPDNEVYTGMKKTMDYLHQHIFQ